MKILLGLAVLLGGASHELGRAMSERRLREPRRAGRCRHETRRRSCRLDTPISGAGSAVGRELAFNDTAAAHPVSPRPGPRDPVERRRRKSDLARTPEATSPPTFVAIEYDAGPGLGPALLIYTQGPKPHTRPQPAGQLDEVIEGTARELDGRWRATPGA